MRTSIITVSLNSVQTIEKTILSVIDQDTDIEYIIIDGGSADGTTDIIKKYENRISYWISEPDSGIYNAMNKGLKQAGGDIIGIINSDDWYEENALSTVEKVFRSENGIDVLYGGVILVDKGNEKPLIYPEFSTLWYQMAVGHPAAFVRRDIYEKYGPFCEDYRIAGDFDLMCRLWNKGVRFAHINRNLSYFRTTGISSNNDSLCRKETDEVCLKHLNTRIFSDCLNGAGVVAGQALYLWGMGRIGKRFLSFLEKCGICVAGIIDSDISRDRTVYKGITIHDYANTDIRENDLIIVTIAKGFGDVSDRIRREKHSAPHVLYYKDIIRLYETKITGLNGRCIELDAGSYSDI